MADYNALMKTYKGFLYCVTVTELAGLNMSSSSRHKEFVFQHPSKQAVNNAKLFWEAAIHSFPLDPSTSNCCRRSLKRMRILACSLRCARSGFSTPCASTAADA
jgi:hypothetical protein